MNTRRSSTVDPSPTFEEEYTDIDHWPLRWRVEPEDLRPGERMLDVFKLFLFDLLSQGLARKTLRLHRDHVCALGGQIIRQLNMNPQLRKRPIVRVLTESLGEDDGPLLHPPRSETDQRSFDSTCRKLHRFLMGSKSTSK